MYGGASAQYPMYGSGAGAAAAAAAFYPYLNFMEGSGGAASNYTTTGGGGQGAYGSTLQYPQHHHQLYQYAAINSATAGGYAQHYGAPISLAPTPPLQSGFYLLPRLISIFKL